MTCNTPRQHAEHYFQEAAELRERAERLKAKADQLTDVANRLLRQAREQESARDHA